MREIGQDLGIKITPDQLAQPGGRARAGRPGQRLGRQCADRDRAKPQVYPQIARSLDRREVALIVVQVNALEKVIQQRLTGALARCYAQREQIGGLKADVGQAGYPCLRALWPVGQGGGVGLDGPGLQAGMGVEVLDAAGRVVATGRLAADRSVDTAGWAPGVYVVRTASGATARVAVK
jgi:hypothetical protein